MVLDILGVEEPDPVHLGSCAAFLRVYELNTFQRSGWVLLRHSAYVHNFAISF